MELFSFKHRQWLLIAVVIFVVAPLVMISLFYGHFRTAVLRKFLVAGVEARSGYKTEPRRLYYREQPLDVYVVSSIEPNGRMDAAGLRIGDVPMEVFHMTDVSLAEKLSAPDASTIRLEVIDIESYAEWVSNDLSGPMWEKQRELIVPSER